MQRFHTRSQVARPGNSLLQFSRHTLECTEDEDSTRWPASVCACHDACSWRCLLCRSTARRWRFESCLGSIAIPREHTLSLNMEQSVPVCRRLLAPQCVIAALSRLVVGRLPRLHSVVGLAQQRDPFGSATVSEPWRCALLSTASIHSQEKFSHKLGVGRHRSGGVCPLLTSWLPSFASSLREGVFMHFGLARCTARSQMCTPSESSINLHASTSWRLKVWKPRVGSKSSCDASRCSGRAHGSPVASVSESHNRLPPADYHVSAAGISSCLRGLSRTGKAIRTHARTSARSESAMCSRTNTTATNSGQRF